ncbi:MAG: TetR/AcrR family transcriptional regulator [Anaerolineaceae bacterium]|nr:TetR/AcrR family transcriptional regulator [Anaerolineaceae bacterium]
MPEKTRSKGEQTRTNIVEAAHSLFLDQGYHGTSMRQISRQAGISLGGIYNHFVNKEEIFEAVFLQNHPFLDILPALLKAEGGTPELLVRDMAAHTVDSYNKHPGFLKLMFIEIIEFKSVHTIGMFNTIFPQASAHVERVISTERGGVRDIPAQIMIRSFISLFFSYYLSEVILSPNPELPFAYRDRAMDYFVDIYLHGILARDD